MSSREKERRAGLSRRNLIRAGGATTAGLALTPALSSCGIGKSIRGADSGVIWASWGNPGEAERFQEVTRMYTEEYGVPVEYQNVVGDYSSKILTQLSGNAAADVFYVGDTLLTTLVDNELIVDLTDYLATPDSPAQLENFFPGLLDWCQPPGGGTYGLPVDCNPLMTWFNRGLLEEAGISEDPAAALENGRWNIDALTDMLTTLRQKDIRGLAFEAGWSHLFSYISSFGGELFDPETNEPVFNTDPRSLEAFEWVFEQIESGNLAYAGELPKGQGADALFFSEQLAMVQMGRWILPNLRDLEIDYDIAPYPTQDGKTFSPAAIAVAAMSVNADAPNPEKSLEFLARYVNADGQKLRLSGGGNAVPSVEGLDDIVLENDVPEHGAWFNDAAAVGFAIPLALVLRPTVAVNLSTEMNEWFLAKEDTPKSFADKMATYILEGEV